MAYVARFSQARGVPVTATLLRRGDKWYIDPEEAKHYDPPFHIKYGSVWPMTSPPEQSGYGIWQHPDSPYPRMSYYPRELRSNQIKWDYADGQRRNFGETMHVLEDWLLPQSGEWVRENGQTYTWKGIAELIAIYGFFYALMLICDYYDKKYCLSFCAPKVYPFDNLYVEQGGNNLIPQELRPYVSRGIPHVLPESSQQC